MYQPLAPTTKKPLPPPHPDNKPEDFTQVSANAASFSTLSLSARNPFSPHRPRPVPVSFPPTPSTPSLGPQVAPTTLTEPQAASSSRPSRAGYRVCRARDPPRARPPPPPPPLATAAGGDTSSPGTVRVPHLPVTPQQPRASHRHRLPQQPANCSITTGPLIEWAGALNNSRSHWPRRRLGPPSGAPPKRVRPGARKTRFPHPSPQHPRARSDAGCRVGGTV